MSKNTHELHKVVIDDTKNSISIKFLSIFGAISHNNTHSLWSFFVEIFWRKIDPDLRLIWKNQFKLIFIVRQIVSIVLWDKILNELYCDIMEEWLVN